MPQPKITIVKEFTYRGKPEEFSNSYYFTGPVPSDNPGWKALGDAIWAAERPCMHMQVKVVQYYGYLAGATQSVAQIDRRLEVIGTRSGSAAVTSGDKTSGDQAATMRALVGNSVKGKKVYVRKFFHGTGLDANDSDLVSGVILTALTACATALTDGSLPGGVKWCSPSGAQATQPSGQRFITVRTLKRRGRRPSP
jgi:hypothetical protein